MEKLKIKIEIILSMDDVKKALEKRGITVNKTNFRKMVDLIKRGSFDLRSEFYDELPKDREMLEFYGFSFDKKEVKDDKDSN